MLRHDISHTSDNKLFEKSDSRRPCDVPSNVLHTMHVVSKTILIFSKKQIPGSPTTIFYRLVSEPPLFIILVRVYHHPRRITIFKMVVDFQGNPSILGNSTCWLMLFWGPCVSENVTRNQTLFKATKTMIGDQDGSRIEISY